jgi:hypothetical protein
MKTRLSVLLIVIFITLISNAQDQTVTVELPLSDNCKTLLSKKLDFLIDGSFQDEASLQKEIAR